LGVTEKEKFDNGGPVNLKTGDIVVIGTDGIWEAQNEDGEFYGKDRFYNILSTSLACSADEICSRAIESVMNFVAMAPRTDDITLIVVKVK